MIAKICNNNFIKIDTLDLSHQRSCQVTTHQDAAHLLDHSHPPDWRMKNFTQEYNNSTASIQSNLYKINRAENLVADSLTRNALSLASTVHQPFSLDCSFGAHESQCPMFQALKSVTTTMHSVWLLAASCC